MIPKSGWEMLVENPAIWLDKIFRDIADIKNMEINT